MNKNTITLPLCYRFSFNVETMTLFLKIQKWMITEMQNHLRAETLLMQYLYKTYGGDKTLFASFGEHGQSFGWKNSIIWSGETDDEIIYSYTLCPVIEQTDEVCERCKGTKIDFLEHPCDECRTTGKKHVPSNNHFSDGMLSLYPIIRFANGALLDHCISDKTSVWKPETNKKQKVAIEWTDTTGMHNCSMSAWVDHSVIAEIDNFSDDKIKDVIVAMKKTEEVLLLREASQHSFRFGCYNDYFGFEVPGNACTLWMSSSGLGMFGGIGDTLQPHNIDNRFQQIEFIVGLAVLNDILEKDMK